MLFAGQLPVECSPLHVLHAIKLEDRITGSPLITTQMFSSFVVYQLDEPEKKLDEARHEFCGLKSHIRNTHWPRGKKILHSKECKHFLYMLPPRFHPLGCCHVLTLAHRTTR